MRREISRKAGNSRHKCKRREQERDDRNENKACSEAAGMAEGDNGMPEQRGASAKVVRGASNQYGDVL